MLATLDEMSRSPLNGNNQIVYGPRKNLKSKIAAKPTSSSFSMQEQRSQHELSRFFADICVGPTNRLADTLAAIGAKSPP
jgi:hypothetical protein